MSSGGGDERLDDVDFVFQVDSDEKTGFQVATEACFTSAAAAAPGRGSAPGSPFSRTFNQALFYSSPFDSVGFQQGGGERANT